ncbi:delta subunit of GMP phosphodiesterase [Baffinella frigidus]|nr:delta subunit of GMP phosphodiesterase [Cryptophyta sp. CCMP2293]
MPYVDLTPIQCLELKAPTADFLCPLTANTYGLEFVEFRQRTLYHVKKPEDAAIEPIVDLPPELERQYRLIQYQFPADMLSVDTVGTSLFPADMLSVDTVGTSLVFTVGDKEVPSFRMIERHYFRNKLLKSFDFTLGFCMPHSTNTWEVIYSLPPVPSPLPHVVSLV